MVFTWASLTVVACESSSDGVEGGGTGQDGDDAGRDGDGAPKTFLDGDLEAELPAQLSELGLFADPRDRSRWHERAHLFEPEHPLWTNGSAKQRFVVVPRGESIDSSGEIWTFPAGTLFFKTFSYASEGGERPIETRLIRRTDDGYDFVTYLWNEDGSDAELLDGTRPVDVEVEVDGVVFAHQVPSKLQCRTCHETHDPMVLGFEEIQLTSSLAGQSDSQLELLHAAGVLSDVPAEPRKISEADPTKRAVLAYFQGNCVHCHDGGSGVNSAFDLRFEVAFENTIGVDTTSELLSGLRVSPGEPLESALYLALTRDLELAPQPMPPLGVQRRDDEAVALVERWIESLDP